MNSKSGWKLNKEINIGEMLSILTMLAVVLAYVFGIDKRVEKNEIDNSHQQKEILENKANINKSLVTIEKQRLENKADIQRLSSDVKQSNTEQNAKIDRIYDFILKSESERKGG